MRQIGRLPLSVLARAPLPKLSGHLVYKLLRVCKAHKIPIPVDLEAEADAWGFIVKDIPSTTDKTYEEAEKMMSEAFPDDDDEEEPEVEVAIVPKKRGRPKNV